MFCGRVAPAGASAYSEGGPIRGVPDERERGSLGELGVCAIRMLSEESGDWRESLLGTYLVSEAGGGFGDCSCVGFGGGE